MDLRNHTILITGGSSGLGLEFAHQLLALGNTVLLTGRDLAKLNQVKQQLPAVHVFQSDVSQLADIERLRTQVLAQFPKLDMLLNNAGEMRKLNLNDPALDVAAMTREVDSNLLGPIRMVQEFLPHLKRQPSATILNVSSGLALVPFPVSPVYCAAKAGLHSYTQSLRAQLRGTRVQVFELLAPAAKTPLIDQFKSMKASSLMAPAKLIAATLKGMRNNQFEIYPGQSNGLRWMDRLAPGFIRRQLSQPLTQEFGQL
jgi:uncharacterized oxidoreductase